MVNWARSRVQRLKSPRYLVPTLVGLAYFVLVFGPWQRVGSVPSTPLMEKVDRQTTVLIEWAATAAAFLMATGAWIFPSRSPPLPFLEAEVAWLFPAPLERRELVRYKILDLQKYLLLSMVLIALMALFRAGAAKGAMVFGGGWLALNVLTLHQIGARFTRQSLVEHGVSGFRRQAPALLGLAALLGTVAFLSPPLPRFHLQTLYGQSVDWLEALGASPAGWALYPFRLIPGPALAQDLPTFLVRCVPLGALATLLYLWVVRCDVAFEEAASAFAQDLTRRMEAARKGKAFVAEGEVRPARRSLWRLSPVGPPEVAFVWKSITESMRGFSPRILGILLASLVIGLSFAVGSSSQGLRQGLATMLAGLLLAFAGLLVLGGPSFLGTSLRADLESVETLKSLPLTGARVVRGELAGTVAPTAVLQVLLVVAAAILMPSPKNVDLTAAWRMAGAAALAAILPCLTALSAAADSAGVLFFPAWVRPGQAQMQGGVEGMGYGIVMALGKFLLLALGTAVPGGIGVAFVVVLRLAAGDVVLPAAVLVGAFLAAGGILVEVLALTAFLGRRFEKLDPSEESMIP